MSDFALFVCVLVLWALAAVLLLLVIELIRLPLSWAWRATAQRRYVMWLRLALATGQYECWPHYNRWLAGVHVFAWSMSCGWTARQSLADAMGYWRR